MAQSNSFDRAVLSDLTAPSLQNADVYEAVVSADRVVASDMRCSQSSRSSRVASDRGMQLSNRHWIRNADMPSSPGEYQSDWKRFLALAHFVTLSLSLAMQWIAFSNAVPETRHLFGITAQQVDLLNTIFYVEMIVTLPIGIVCGDIFGVKFSAMASSSFSCAGAIIRLLVALFYPHYWAVLLTCLVIGGSQMFFIEAPPLLSAEWFPANERTLATLIAAAGNNMGIALGMLLTPLVLDAYRSGPDDSAASGPSRWFGMAATWSNIVDSGRQRFGDTAALSLVGDNGDHALIAILCGLAALALIDFLFGLLAVPRRPMRPPSAAAAMRDAESARLVRTGESRFMLPAVWADFKGVMSDRDTRLCTFAMSCLLGTLWGLSAFLSQIIVPFGLSQTAAGWMGFGNIVLGTGVSIPICRHVDRRRVYRKPLLLLLVFGAACFILFVVCFACFSSDMVVYPAMALYIAMGVAQAGAVPLAFEFVTELSYPASSNIGSGTMIMSASCLTLGLMLGLGALLGDSPSAASSFKCLGTFGVLWFVAILLLTVCREHLRRKDYEVALTAEDDDGDQFSVRGTLGLDFASHAATEASQKPLIAGEH